MCGIAALICATSPSIDPGVIERMTKTVRHRGPDGHGVALLHLDPTGVREVSPSSGQSWQVALGHRRLSIIDLSDAGRQPMSYRDRLWIVFNGEIYNYVELRQGLERAGHTFRSHTDTEVILAAYDEWGNDCFQRLRGMWGIVLIDARRRVAVLSRDRLGIKPVYLASVGGVLAVASEIKQLAHLPGFQISPNDAVVHDYLRTGYEQEGQTFFAGVTPLSPGVYQEIDLTTGKRGPEEAYWFPERIKQTIHDPAEAGREFRRVFEESVRIHLRSDVPVGCALSGGLDSSAVAGCIRDLAKDSSRFHTFSVVFPGSATDETPYVEQVVAAVHSTSHFVTPTAEQFVADLDRWLWIHDEPVGSMSQYAGYALARLTREAGVPVTLNGQGGDEILGGYWQSYFLYLRGLFRSGRLFGAAYHLAGALVPGGNPELPRQAPAMWRRYTARKRASATTPSSGYASQNNELRHETANGKIARVMGMSETERRLYEIRSLYLPRLLKWDDRNFMAFAVEGRYPFLDHTVIETALSFSSHVLYCRGWTKEPLRRGMVGLLPTAILRRRSKWGFETPQLRWIRGQLRPILAEWLAGDSPLWGFGSRPMARQLAAQVWESATDHEEPAQQLFWMFLTDRWLRLLPSA